MYRANRDMYAFKVISTTFRSFRGNTVWYMGEQNRLTNHYPLVVCSNGFHCSWRMSDALNFGKMLAPTNRAKLMLVKISRASKYLEAPQKMVTRRLTPIACINIDMSRPSYVFTNKRRLAKLLKVAKLTKDIFGGRNPL